MSEKIEKMLDEQIMHQIGGLSNLEDGTDEKKAAVEQIRELYRLRIEDTKLEIEKERLNDEIVSRTTDQRLKESEIKEQVRDRYFKVGIAAAELVVPLIFYGVWMNKGFEFEKEGTFTSTTFRGLINRFRPTKK